MVGLERGRVVLEPYKQEWSDQYEAEVARLRAIAGDRLLGFEHIGSTAIEGMPAKPIIDLIAFVDSLDNAEDIITCLENNGYELRPDDDVPERLFLAKGPQTNRTHYLSLAEPNSDFSVEKVAFRDYLQAHPETAEEYASLKESLADRYAEQRARYTAEKGAFIQDVLERAMTEE